ncbi:MAG TPA: hypothetical protein VIK83_00955 [Coriobacteriia bacterium]
MEQGTGRKHLISTVAVVSVILAAGFLFVTMSPSGWALVGGPTTLLGWAIPLVSLFVVVAVTWFVIVRDARDVLDESAHYVTCGSCSHSIQSEWRMCPFCGAEVRPSATDAATDAAGAAHSS